MLSVNSDGSPGPVSPVDRIGAWMTLTRNLWSDEDMTPELVASFRAALVAVLGAYQSPIDVDQAVDEFGGGLSVGGRCLTFKGKT